MNSFCGKMLTDKISWVYVQHIDKNGDLWVMPCNKLNVMKHIYWSMNRKPDPKTPLFNVTIGQIVSVLHEDIWYRAKVTAIDSDYKLFLVDFGVILHVPLPKIFNLPHNLRFTHEVVAKVKLNRYQSLHVNVGDTILVKYESSIGEQLHMSLVTPDEHHLQKLPDCFKSPEFEISFVYGLLVSGLKLHIYFQMHTTPPSSTVPCPQYDAASPVLYLTNLNTEKLRPIHLFNLFSLYGVVVAIKILPQKKVAFVQMKDTTEATSIIAKLRHVNIFNTPVEIMFAKSQKVIVKKEDVDLNVGQDFQHSSTKHMQRTKLSKMLPSCTLYIRHIMNTVTDQQIMDAFDLQGYKIKSLKSVHCEDFQRIAYATFGTVEEATNALMVMHMKELTHWGKIYIAFAPDL